MSAPKPERMGCIGWGAVSVFAISVLASLGGCSAPPETPDRAADSVGQAAQEAQRREAEAQRQRLAEACPGKRVTGPVPANLARDLRKFITEAAATERGDVLIIMVTRAMADAITLRSLAIEAALIGMGTSGQPRPGGP